MNSSISTRFVMITPSSFLFSLFINNPWFYLAVNFILYIDNLHKYHNTHACIETKSKQKLRTILDLTISQNNKMMHYGIFTSAGLYIEDILVALNTGILKCSFQQKNYIKKLKKPCKLFYYLQQHGQNAHCHLNLWGIWI